MKINFESIVNSLKDWMSSLSERTLTLSSIAILHCMFLPNALAYLNGITSDLPNLDAYLLLVLALGIMNLRSIISNDKVATLIHMLGFISQLSLLAIILMK